MSRLLILAALLVALIVAAPAATAGEILLDTEGSRSGLSQRFETTGPWLLTWRVNSDFRQQAGLVVDLVDADSGLFKRRVLRRGAVGGGYKLFRDVGRFRFEISTSLAKYELKIEQLTEAEAAELEPVGG
ncbi:MAG: hypothetical protein AAGF46_03080 [Pseudomonadota bacterium]